MTSTFSYDSSENQIFLLSALGSLLIHGALISLLAFLPRTPPIEDSTPTIQVKLVETQLETQDNSSIQPLFPAHSIPPPPSPTQTRKTIQPSPATPIQPSLASPTSLAQAPSPSLTPTQPILKDTRAAQAMKARDLMKMTTPIQAAQMPQSSPSARSHKKYSNPAMLSSTQLYIAWSGGGGSPPSGGCQTTIGEPNTTRSRRRAPGDSRTRRRTGVATPTQWAKPWARGVPRE